MGTNYYLTHDMRCACCICQACDITHARTHIGKSSAGWVFALHVYPGWEILDYADWELLWGNGTITDEYGTVITIPEMRQIILNRSWPHARGEPSSSYWSWEHFHLVNHSMFGPRGLLRTKLSERCIKHGVGTYDCHVGEFS